MTNEDAIATLVALTSQGEVTKVRLEAARSLATYLHDERAVRALKDLASSGNLEEVRIEAIKVLGGRS